MRDRSHDPRRRPPADRRVVTAVWLGVVSAVLLFSALTLVSAWLRGGREVPRADLEPFVAVAPDVDLWVGDVAPGVKGVLSPPWNQPAWDARQDEVLSGALGRSGRDALAFGTLVVFNTSDAAATVPTGAGSLVLRGADGGKVPSVSLALILDGAAGAAAATTLRRLGAGRDTVDVPPDRMARVPVAFPRSVPLGEAVGVERGDGSPFRRRRMAQREWAGLLQSPSVDALRDL
jgi:hypothetical protein